MNIYAIFSLLGFSLVSISASSDFKRPGKVIIDTDGGGDDAAAILLALETEKQLTNDDFEVIAITCTYGNTNIENVEQNVLKTLTIANRTDIPVYAGVSKPLINNQSIDFHFGLDGLGDIIFREAIGGRIDRSKHASVALVDLAREHAGKVSILVLGPLSTVAIAITLDPNFLNNIERLYIMGASVMGMGNVAPAAEFNFYQDPHSNFIVLSNIKAPPAVLLPWESAVATDIPMDWRTEILGAVDSRAIKFLNQVERKSIEGAKTWVVADVLLTGLMLWPKLITSSAAKYLSPVYDGSAQGSVLVDYNNVTHNPPNVEILMNFDVENYKQLLIDTFSMET